METRKMYEINSLIITNDKTLPIVLDQHDDFLYTLMSDSPFGKEEIIERIKQYPKQYDKQIEYIKNNLFKIHNRNVSINLITFLSKQGIDVHDYYKMVIDEYILDSPTVCLNFAERYGCTEYAIKKIFDSYEKGKGVINSMLLSLLVNHIPKKDLGTLLNIYLDSCDEINMNEIEYIYYCFNGNKKLFDIMIGDYLAKNDIKGICKLIKDSKDNDIDVGKFIDKKVFAEILNKNKRSDYIFDLAYALKDVIPDVVNKIFKNNHKFLINRLSSIMIDYPVNAPKKSKAIIGMIIEELLNNQGLQLQDITIYESGGYSNVLGIGDLVLKISKPRETFEIPNSKYILQPIIRKQFDEFKKLTIEVQPKVITEGIKNEEIEQLYKNIRAEGLHWTDIKSENVGRLIKPNKAIYKMRTGNIQSSFESTGLKGEVDTLPAGEIVIIDSDYIYNKMTKKSVVPNYSLYEEFENKHINSK